MANKLKRFERIEVLWFAAKYADDAHSTPRDK